MLAAPAWPLLGLVRGCPHNTHSSLLVHHCLCAAARQTMQKDLLESCDIDVVLVGHAMTQDQEHAELFEIEW